MTSKYLGGYFLSKRVGLRASWSKNTGIMNEETSARSNFALGEEWRGSKLGVNSRELWVKINQKNADI